MRKVYILPPKDRIQKQFIREGKEALINKGSLNSKRKERKRNLGITIWQAIGKAK